MDWIFLWGYKGGIDGEYFVSRIIRTNFDDKLEDKAFLI